MSVLIPLRRTRDAIEIPHAQLPEDPTVLINILIREDSTAEIWLEVAIAYSKRLKFPAFKTVLERGIAHSKQR